MLCNGKGKGLVGEVEILNGKGKDLVGGVGILCNGKDQRLGAGTGMLFVFLNRFKSSF